MILKLLTLFSALIFFGFNAATVRRQATLQESYSALFYEWPRTDTVSVFSAVTFLVAFLLMPALIGQGEGNPLQFLGFLAPIYLIIVAIRPDFKADRRTFLMHSCAALICAACSLAWLLLVRHAWWALVLSASAAVALALMSDTAKDCKVFWAEMIMFISVYLSILI